jgi:hypothetical protein
VCHLALFSKKEKIISIIFKSLEVVADAAFKAPLLLEIRG